MAKSKRKDGRLEKKITIDGVQYHIYGRTLAEIKEKEQEKRQEIKQGFSARNNPTINTYFDNWLERSRDSIKEATYIRYTSQIKTICNVKIIDRTFGSIRIQSVNIDDLRILQSTLSNNRVSTYVNGIMSLIKRIMQDATNERIIDYNPATLLKSIKRTEDKARDTYHRALTKDETKRFFDCETTKNSIYYNVYRIAINTGMRIGEIGALKASDIYKNNIHVVRSLTMKNSGTREIGDDTKTAAGKRTIPVNDNIRAILEDQKRINATLDGITDINDPLRGILFKSPTRNLLNDQQINDEITAICQQLDIERFTMHAFRDTFATRAIESGIDPKTLQEILGHSDISMTLNLYAHVMDDTKHEAMQKIVIAI